MGETVTLDAEDGNEFTAHRARPSASPRGGLVVIQEVFGVNDHIRLVADGFAAEGFDAIAPALFDRKEAGVELTYDADGLQRGRALRVALGWDAPLRDIAAAIAAVAESGKVGVVGYCWGGSLAWLSATRLDIACSVAYYGGQINQFRGETPRCPTLLQFGETDAFIPSEHHQLIAERHPDIPIHVYPAGHGFNCDARADYHADSARLARERTLAFLAEHVG